MKYKDKDNVITIEILYNHNHGKYFGRIKGSDDGGGNEIDCFLKTKQEVVNYLLYQIQHESAPVPKVPKDSKCEIHKILNEIKTILQKKGEDYSDKDRFETFKSASIVEVEPYQSILTRIIDKIKRLHNIMKKGTTNFESADQEALDIAGYAVLLTAMLRETKVNDKTIEVN